jgi:hypothetical protein
MNHSVFLSETLSSGFEFRQNLLNPKTVLQGICPVASSCEYGNEPVGPVKHRESIKYPS